MAVSPLNPKTSYHARSISLPCESHPYTLKVEEQLEGLLRASKTTSTTSSLCHNLGCLKDLFDRVDDLLQFFQTQQALTDDHQERDIINQVLDGSLRLLDVCGTIREVLSKMMDLVQVLRLSLRRRRGCKSDLKKEVMTYLSSRRQLKKGIHKCLGQMKGACLLPIDKGYSVNVVLMLKEVEVITLCVLESLLSFVYGPITKSKPRKWSLICKLMQTKKKTCWVGEDEDSSEVEKVDVALSTFVTQNLCKDGDTDTGMIRVQRIQTQLEAMEVVIKGLQDGLESVFRSIMKSRVSLLNILSQ
ncbi:hypothetical protein NE237_032276 [Protea cynaroides]|uniref:Uncharacterized protein n=1 Tax=Protea cynaroides TaxID=273540 RepID=A0A9Q0L305_9MAGN|nr:hypothetical protein NE237_032276 [Protea cynaroides]